MGAWAASLTCISPLALMLGSAGRSAKGLNLQLGQRGSGLARSQFMRQTSWKTCLQASFRTEQPGTSLGRTYVSKQTVQMSSPTSTKFLENCITGRSVSMAAILTREDVNRS